MSACSIGRGLSLLGTAIALATGCAAPSNTETSVPQAKSAKAIEAAVQPSTRAVISGRLRAHDGGALTKAEVSVRRSGFEEVSSRVEVDAEGQFRVEVDPGIYLISLAAVDHAVVHRNAEVVGAIEVAGTLGTYERAAAGDTLRINSDLLDAAGSTIGAGPTSAKRVQGDVFRLEVGGAAKTAPRLRYQIVHEGRTSNGPAPSYQSDGGGDYWSVLDLAGRDAVEIDLATLPPAGRAPKLTWSGEPPTTALLLASIERWATQLAALRRDIPRTDGKIMVPSEANRAAAKALADAAYSEADAATDPAARMLLRAAALAAFHPYTRTSGDTATGRDALQWIVENVPPDEPRTALILGLDHVVVPTLREADADLTARTEAWLDRRANENPEPAVAIQALQILIDQADRRDDDTSMRALYTRAIAPRLAGTYYHRFIQERYDPDRPLQVGKTLPTFDFAALEGDERVTSGAYEGRLYLLEFWATWCAPCVAEMPKLHDVYATINGVRRPKRGKPDALRRMAAVKQPKIEFVFVSLDSEPADVAAFRKEHWSMPWVHGFVGNSGREKAVMKRFGFSGVPTAILIDERGAIVEVGESLRGDQLRTTLQRVLAEHASK